MSKVKKRGTITPLPFLGGSFGANQQRGGRGGSYNGTTGGRSTRTATPLPGLTPGMSVVPGSIDVPNKDGGVWHSSNPENVWWSQMEGFNTLDWIISLLQNSNKGGSLSQGYADVIKTIKDQIATNPDGAINPDMIMSLFTNLLSYQSTQEQRGYDYMMLNESRQYNNPTNELARLMGAGVSRDAAIQILSGSAGGQGFGGAGSAASVQGPAAGAGAAALNSSNAHQNLVNNVYNGIQMVANLVSQGLSIAQGVEQVKGMNMQNTFTQNQLSAFQGVNEVTEFLHNAQISGLLEPSTMEGFKNAEDVFKWILKNQDNEQVAPLLQSGAVQRAFGSTYGREMFNNHWKEQNRSRTDGQILDQFLRYQDAQIAIAELQPAMIGAEMQNLNFQNMKLSAESQLFFQNIQESFARINLMNEQGEFIHWNAENAHLNYELNAAGFPIMKQLRIDQLTFESKKWLAFMGKGTGEFSNYKTKGVDGVLRSPMDNAIIAWLREGTNAADAMYLKQLYQGAIGSFAVEHPTLYKLAQLFDTFGVFRWIGDAGFESAQNTQNMVVDMTTSGMNVLH